MAGQVFTVLDGENRKLEGASLYLGGQRYEAGEDGRIVVPFSNEPGRQPIVLAQGGFATLESFEHEAESYALSAGIHVDREALLSRAKAEVLVRPSLTLNGTPATLKVLEDPRLVIASTDREGVSTTKEVADFELHLDRESTYEFQVPPKKLSKRKV